MADTVLPVAIVGGGLAGLYAARLLHAQGIPFRIFEARSRLGGRILSVDAAGRVAADGFDLGPSWFWPELQPELAALVAELGLAAFPQHDAGYVLIERLPDRAPQRYPAFRQQPGSMRIAGGTGVLVAALVAGLPKGSIRCAARLTGLVPNRDRVHLTVQEPDGASAKVAAAQVIAALPPRLMEATVDFEPPVEPGTRRRWHDTPTWMAPHAKFVALYDRSFWRAAGLSGTARSTLGPLAEVHDATTASGSAALFGFVGIGADRRAKLGRPALVAACLDQLARLFGADAGRPAATLLMDWALEALTATAADGTDATHPSPLAGPWVRGPWRDRLSLAGSETGPNAPGYLAGAIEAATRAVAEVSERLARATRPAAAPGFPSSIAEART